MSTVDQANCNYIDTSEQDEHFLDRVDFLAYAAMVEAVVHAAGKAVCTREIHEALGAEARREWTLDAVENLRSVELVPGLINRWQVYNATSPKLTNLLNGRNPSFLFSGQRKQQREAEFRQQDAEKASRDDRNAVIRYDPETLKPVEGKGRPPAGTVTVQPIRSGRLFDRKEIRKLVSQSRRQYRSANKPVKASQI